MHHTTLDDLVDALKFIDPNLEREHWVKVAMGIKSEFGDIGYDPFVDWSKTETRNCFKEHSCRSTWRGISVNGGITIKTVFDMAKEGGYKPSKKTYTEEEKAAFKKEQAKRAAERKRLEELERIETEKWHQTISKLSLEILNHCKETNSNKYLSNKKVAAFGTKSASHAFIAVVRPDFVTEIINGADNIKQFFANLPKDDDERDYSFTWFKRGDLVLPLMDEERQIWNVQRVNATGDKKFLKHGRKSGLFFFIGSAKKSEYVAFVEGYATGATIHMAMSWPCAVALDAGNLGNVSYALKQKLPDKKFLFLADNDIYTKNNPGVTSATAAAKNCDGLVFAPNFETAEKEILGSEEKKLTDWNDMHVEAGLNTVKQQLSDALQQVLNPAEPPIPQQTADARQRDAGDWTMAFQKTNNGNVMANISNTKLVLECDLGFDGVLGYCQFSYRITKLKPPPFKMGECGEWSDTDTERLRLYLSQQYGFTPKPSDVLGAVIVHAEDHAFHPVREYLHSVSWDKKHRIPHWLHNYLGVEDSEYSTIVGAYFLISAIARVMQAPVKADYVLILEGLQGLGKSTMLRVLFGDWFTDTPMALGEKDTFQQMQGMWGIELAELDAFNKAENTRAKQFFGSLVDRYRPSYGRMVKEFPRQCVFIGTTNQDRYLKDSTGNRRYWPVTCTDIKLGLLKRDRDQLWAEALHMYQSGHKWWPDDEYKHLFEEQQEDRYDSDVWEDLIKTWLSASTRSDITCALIMEDALKMDPQAMRPPDQRRVGQILHRLGYIKKKRRQPDGSRPAFYVKQDTSDHASA